MKIELLTQNQMVSLFILKSTLYLSLSQNCKFFKGAKRNNSAKEREYYNEGISNRASENHQC